MTSNAGLRHISVVKNGGEPRQARVAGLALLRRNDVIGGLALRNRAIVTKDAGLRDLVMVHPQDLLPVEAVVTAFTLV